MMEELECAHDSERFVKARQPSQPIVNHMLLITDIALMSKDGGSKVSIHTVAHVKVLTRDCA